MQHRHSTSGLRAPIFGVLKDFELRTKSRKVFIMNVIRNYRNWRRYRETVSELNRLSARELSDLGINRADIPFVARKAI